MRDTWSVIDETPPEKVPQSLMGALISVPATPQDKAEYTAWARAENAKRRAWNAEYKSRLPRNREEAQTWSLNEGPVYLKRPPVDGFIKIIGALFVLLCAGLAATIIGAIGLALQ